MDVKQPKKKLTATRRNNSMSHSNDIEASLRENKNQNSSETTCVLFPQKNPRFTYKNIKPITTPNNYCNLYYSTSERPNSIRALLYRTYNG